MKRKIYFRADASVSIGYGHFIRTLALADMLKDDFDCTFFTCHPTPYQVDEMEKVCPFLALREETHYDDFLSHLQGDEIAVLDNYFFDTGYQRAIKGKGCRLVCIDDMHDKHYVADVLIHHGFADASLFDCENYTVKCIGIDWAMLRRPFLKPLPETNQRDQSIVICLGGSDSLRLTEKIATYLLNLGCDSPIKAIVGDKAVISEEIQNSIHVLSRLTAEEISELFRHSAYAILSASTVCIEALYSGIKVMVGYYIDNQKDCYECLERKKMVAPLLFLPELTEQTLEESISKADEYTAPHYDATSIKTKYISLFKKLSTL